MLELEERPAVRVEPAKQWRNWYRVHRRMRTTSRVGVWHPGDTPGPDLFPSREIAQQKANDFIAAVFPHARSWFDHLGAFPESVTPE
jgi:hypothetical protein